VTVIFHDPHHILVKTPRLAVIGELLAGDDNLIEQVVQREAATSSGSVIRATNPAGQWIPVAVVLAVVFEGRFWASFHKSINPKA
jgi:hypothetical protein